MRKFVSVGVILGMIMTLSVVVSVASDVDDQPTKTKDVVTEQATNQDAINSQEDKRIITPDMNWREKVETQRNIRKRAAAMRNQLMQDAELERQNQPQPIRSAPIVK